MFLHVLHPLHFSNRVLIKFLYDTRYNKIDQMAGLRMDWYSLISIHKSASRAMLSEYLMILDHLCVE